MRRTFLGWRSVACALAALAQPALAQTAFPFAGSSDTPNPPPLSAHTRNGQIGLDEAGATKVDVNGGQIYTPDGAVQVAVPGDLGSVNLPSDGYNIGGAVTIGDPNPSGFYSSGAALGIILGCNRLATGQFDPSTCASGGINGGFGAPYPAGLQAALNYGGVDTAGIFVGGVYTPPTYVGVTLSGSSGTRLTLPAGQTLPAQWRRLNTFVYLSGLTDPVIGMILDADPNGTWVDVSGWGDFTSRATGVNPTAAPLAGSGPISATIGYAMSAFGANIVTASVAGGPPVAKTGEGDLGCNLASPCLNNTGWTENGFGLNYNGLGFGVDGGVGTATAAHPFGFPAWFDGISVRSCVYRCFYAEQNFDNTLANNAGVGFYDDTIGGVAIDVHNPNQPTAPGPGNVFAVSGTDGSVYSFGGLTTVGGVTAGGTIQAGGGLIVQGTSSSYAIRGLNAAGGVIFVMDGAGATHFFNAAEFDGVLTVPATASTSPAPTVGAACGIANAMFAASGYIWDCDAGIWKRATLAAS